ncbi:flagellar protein FliT [Marichromatium bheemlicum]|uniref:Flagellar protein FliT n=1 Tax=Marichromatium bheemlicum TaxID=365339 RepID=A0ABX1I7C9_9GAMM|nr:flagellar protein FliT [Marichromatium bheemlicum]NKN33168.1 flagellar protein FliT [Marichromatium bheemlicum]
MTMPDDLISQLEHATAQLLGAATGADWPLVERLQKRRRVLIERLCASVSAETLSESARQRLQQVLEQEGRAETRAIAGRAEILRELQRLRTPPGETPQDQRPAHTVQRMRKAYGGPK